MKALVLEVKDGYSACLKEDGTVTRVRGVHPIGKSIELKDSRILDFVRENTHRVCIAAAAVACVFLGSGVYSYNNLIPASYVSIDVNPSLEYGLSRRNRVLSVKALNEDAEPIVEELKSMHLRQMTVAEGVEKATEVLKSREYIAEGRDNVMLLGITGENVKSSETISREVAVGDAEVTLHKVEATPAERKEAKKRGVSAGRYMTAKAICDKNNLDISDITEAEFDELAHQSVAELIREEEDEAAGEELVIAEELPEAEETEEHVKESASASSVSAASEQAKLTEASEPAAVKEAEPEEEKEEEKQENKSSSKKKKKTVSSVSADKTTQSSNKASDNTSEKTAGSTTSSNATEDKTAAPQTPAESADKPPQDMSVDEYQQIYNDSQPVDPGHFEEVTGDPNANPPEETPVVIVGDVEVAQDDPSGTETIPEPMLSDQQSADELLLD